MVQWPSAAMVFVCDEDHYTRSVERPTNPNISFRTYRRPTIPRGDVLRPVERPAFDQKRRVHQPARSERLWQSHTVKLVPGSMSITGTLSFTVRPCRTARWPRMGCFRKMSCRLAQCLQNVMLPVEFQDLDRDKFLPGRSAADAVRPRRFSLQASVGGFRRHAPARRDRASAGDRSSLRSWTSRSARLMR